MANDFLGVRSEAEIAINDLAVACLEAAEVHDAAARGCDDAALEAGLAALAESRRRMSQVVGSYLAERYEGPNWPDQEKELLKRAATRVKSALRPDATASLLADGMAEEERVRDAAAVALRFELSQALRTRISGLQQDAEAQIRWLRGMARV